MEILSVTLKNFKSHRDRHFQFQPGTNAICGENGAGKTSILEAIAWTLFNHRGAYRTEDLVRNGSASAQVTVAFVSNRDQRTYEVSRCTRAGYTIYDPQLGEKLEYSRIEEEVLPWLRQQFGVAPGTDLADLFANTIGVPQGLFTADFLKPDRERKKTFDAILKVEEYRKTSDDLLSLQKYGEAAVKQVTQEIAHYDEELEQWEPLQQQRQRQKQAIAQVQSDLQQAQAKVEHLRQQQEQLSALATQIQQLDHRLEALQSRQQDQSSSLERLTVDLQQAERAAAICTQHREAYQTYLQAEQALQDLEQQRQAEQKLRLQRQKQVEQLAVVQTQRATLTHEIERLAAHQPEIERLQPLIQQQLELEQQQQSLQQQIQACGLTRKTLAAQEKQLKQLQTRQTQLAQEALRLQTLAPVVARIPDLEQQQQRLQQQLSRIAAATQFEADLGQLLAAAQAGGDRYRQQVQQADQTLHELEQAMPLWAEALAEIGDTLQTGLDWQQQWLSGLATILDDLAEQTAVSQLEYQLQTLQTDLQAARQSQSDYANLERVLTDQRQLEAEIADLTAVLDQTRGQLAAEPQLQQQLTDVTQQLTRLADPRATVRLLQQQRQNLPQLQMELEQLQGSLTQQETAIADLDRQLAVFADLSAAIETQQALREQHRLAYQEYLANRELANTRRDRQIQLEAAIARQQELEAEIQTASQDRDRLSQTFDPQEFQSVQSAYQAAHTQQIALSARLPDMEKLLASLEEQQAKLQKLQTRRQQAQTELEQRRKADHWIKFARKAYKEAGPRITERYVQSISREADKLFRELLNRPNVSLEWSRDYEIKVQEGAHPRRFINLSGGEQMCAALAVRLALLKVLADIDIAFFDEPTTNMDRPRREHLAEAIANIKTFRQLFVISHDDTFEQITENILWVDREVS